MSDAEFFIETDSLGRMAIGALDENGIGDGYRLAGRKFCGCCPGKVIVRAKLGDKDVEEIRGYLDRYNLMRAARKQIVDSSVDPDWAAQQETLNGG